MTTNGGSLNFISTYYNFTNTTTFTGPNSFVASGATFNGTIAGTLGWNGGALSGVMTLASNGVLNIVAGGGYYFNGLILTNYGTVSWSNADIYSHGSKNAQIYNYGLWNAQSDNEFYGGYYGGLTVFDNFGTFLKSGNTNTTTLDSGVVFNNNGTVRVRRGTLSINGGGITSGSGVFVTANGAFLDLAGIDFANGATIDGNAAVDLGGNTVVNGVLTGSNLQLVGGTLSGTNVLQGTLTWSGGSMAGNLTIASNSVLNIVAGGGDAFDGLILTNFGTVNWTNTDIYSQGPDNAQIYNYGLWNAQNDNELYGGYYGGTTVFDNFGTFLKSGSTNTTVLDGDVAFNNTGTVNVESGALDLNGNISLDGGTLNFSINSQTDYGTIALAGATVLGGAVSVDFNNGFLPASGSQFQLLSGASLTGTLSTGALPFGMSFVYSKTGVDLVWNGITQAGWAAGTTVLYGTITTTFLESLGTTVQLVATTKGASYVLGATASGGLGTISFNASQLSNGIYSLQAIVVNAAGQVVGDYSRQAFVNNSLAWHEGILSSNQTWGTNGVNAVDENVIIPGGVTLTLAPGAIVKFAEGTGIIIEPGGVLDASGATTNEPIILTAMKDDSAGGDSNEDGDNSVPEPGDWNGILSSGQFLANAYVEVRYVLQTHSGLVRQSQEWSGPQEHFITGNVIVPTNVTLTISPGAIVKFDLGRNITVQAGGTLIATGTVAQPIVFTSINDGSVGVEMNTAATPAAAGDWDSIYISGGKAIFDHVTMSYGGGPDSLNSGLISTIGPGSVVAVSDSILNQALYRGIEAEYGTVNLTNCVVTGCDRGIQSGLSGPTVVNIINCTLDNNNYGLFAHGGVMNVVNSIIADSLTAGLAYCCGSSLSTFEYNDVWSATGTYASSTWPVADQTGLNGNISVNPNFVNAAQGDFELNYGSPCIDAADGAVAPLTDLTGAPRYNDPRTLVKAGIKNANGLYPDMGAFEFVQTASSPIDLIANSVMGPATETAGQTVTVQWNDVNIGTANAIGPWHDTISLVSQGGSRTLAVATVLVAQNVVLGHGQSYPASASVVVPGGQAGSYQWQVQVNSKGDVFEGINWTNNTALATASSVLGDPSLAVGGAPMTNTFTAAGQSRVFTFVSSGGTFALNAQGSTPGCALKLLVGDGYVPDSSRFDFESSQFNSPMASVTVPSNNHDTYYVVVYAISLDASAVSFTLTASTVAFALNSVNPASMVNSGPVTLQVLGGQLAANDTYTLAGPGGTFAATSMQSPDSTVAYATFNLGGAAAGLYNLQVAQPGGPTLTLSNAVVVTSASAAAAAPSFSVQLEIPPAYRANRPFSGAIVYSDTGEVNMPAPILILTSGGVAGMALSGSTDYSTGDLVLVGASFEGPAGTLIPGKSWSIGFSALCTSEATIPFEVDYETADSTNLIDYSTLESSLRPPGYSDANWNEIWNRFQTEAGPTWGGFVSLVDSYSTEMALENSIGTFYLLPDVLAFAYADLLDKASANAIGTVYLHDTNHPAAGVQILLSNDGGTNSSSDTTASDGTFAIDGLPPGTYKVSAPGYWLPAPITVTIPDSDIIAGLAIIVNQGGSISGTLSNAAYGGSPSPASPAYIAQEAGQFLSGISVEAFGESTNAFTTTSDQNGYYSFPGLPPDIYEIVELGGTFGGTTPSSGVQFAIEYATNLVVSDGISLVQDFLVPINGAVAEAQVYAANTSIPITNATVDIGVAPNMIDSTNTDKNGVFAFSVNGSSFMVDISAPGYVAFAGMVGASPNPSRPSIIYLTPASSFDITLNTSSATAITNGVVTVTSNGVVVGMGTTDGNGQVTIGNLAAGTYTVQAGAYGFQDTSTTLTVGVGDVATSSSTMAALGGIIGQVSNDNGVPISGIDVTVYGDGATNQGVDVTIQTDTSGNYAVLGLPPGKYGVSVGNDGGVDPQEIRIVSNEQRTVNFTLAGSVIQGIVLAPDGVTPVPLATVALAQAGEILATALSDTNGNYTFRVLIPGRYALAASASTGLSSNQAVALKSGANLQAAPLVFGPDMLNILVTDTSDNPLTSASIALYPANGVPTVPQIFTEMTDSSGAAAIGGLVAGQYRIVVHQPGFAQFWQTLNLSGNSNITCALNPGVTMSGRITDSTGLPIGQATVALFDPAADMLVASTNTDSAGDYSLTDLYTGSFDVVISQSNYATTEIANVVVNANPFRQKGVLVSKTTSISGTVTDSLGNPLATGLVVITNNGGVVFAMLPTARDGTWSTDQLPPGAYTITIAALGYQPPPPAAVVLLAGNPATLSNALAACVTDDDDEEGISDDGFYANLSVGFGDLIKDVGLNVRPYQISVPGIPAAGDCDKAKQALAACKAALELKENAYINWDEGYRGTSEALGATASIGLVHTLVAAVDALAKFTPAGAGEYLGLAAMNGATKATVVSTSIATTLAHLSTTLDGLQHNLASVNLKDPESLTQFLSSTAADLTANGLDASTMRNLSAGLAEANPGNPYAVAAGAITILNDLWTGIKDYQSAMGIDQANKFAYETATKNYIHALVALENANIDCPPPKPPPIPPPNPIPGPKQPINPVHSGDPNDKFATGIGLPGWVPEGSAITYTIDFENEPNASAAAQEVTISDPLAGNLDWSTLQLTTIAFNNVVINIPAGVQTFSTNVSVTTDPNPVAVSASLNPVTGVISWLMESIDPATGQLIMDPSAGFLPPDNAQGQGEGYVIYTVQPKSGLATGAQLTNRASIVFDVNAAIATPTTTNYVGSGAPIITEQPQNVTTNLGGTAIFTVTLSSNAPYFYQWSKNGTTLAGATNSDLVLGDVQVADAGNYAVSVSTGIASTNSAPAVLTVTTNPSINQIEIVISGNGTVSPHDNGKALQIGHHYAITAIPGRNYLFAGWTGDAFTDAPTLKFVMQSNMLLQASFVTNIFLAAHGNYLGLFAPATAAREQTNSGSFNLNVTTAGVVSGSLVIGLQPVSLNGKFDVTGAAEIHSSRRGQSPLTTTLQLDLANRAVEGTVSDGSFVATLDGEQSVFSASHPATAFEGQYTLIIPGTSDPAAGPFGVSYGTVAVSALGTVTLGGSLADGTPISQSSVVSKEGYWPLYVSLYGGKGSLWGWNYFANHTITNAGALSWINETNSSKTALYRAGFTNQEATITGGLYVPNFELPDDLIVKLEGGNLPSPITVPNLSENVDKLTLKTNKATGVISGSFANPVMLKQIIKVNGVILQGQTKAQGYFLGTNQSGIFRLDPP
ncbi:MAG: carboxypeptidase regulatory-like domain-containing protein [Limisphaerales bacterium]